MGLCRGAGTGDRVDALRRGDPRPAGRLAGVRRGGPARTARRPGSGVLRRRGRGRCGEAAWEALRIEAGVPVAGREVGEATIAAEVGLVERTVSFTKGCFTGQELVARLDARGTKVARRLCGLVVAGGSCDTLPPLGAAVSAASGGPEAGRLTSVAWSPGLDAAVGLTLLHRRIDATGVQSRSPGRSDAGSRHLAGEARPLPLVG